MSQKHQGVLQKVLQSEMSLAHLVFAGFHWIKSAKLKQKNPDSLIGIHFRKTEIQRRWYGSGEAQSLFRRQRKSRLIFLSISVRINTIKYVDEKNCDLMYLSMFGSDQT